MQCDSISASAEAKRHSATFVACSEKSAKFTPPASIVAPSGDGLPGQTRGAVITSVLSFYNLLHDREALRLQRALPVFRQKPHPFVQVTAVKDVDVVVRDCVMEGGAGVLPDEAEEGLAPRVIEEWEEFIAERIQLV